MKRLLIFGFTLLCIVLSSQAQNAILSDPVSATVFSTQKYSGVNGTPFLQEKWVPGSVTISRGVYPKLNLKLDAYSNILYFQVGEEAYEFADPVLHFVLKPIAGDSSSYQYFVRGKSGPSLKEDQFVQVLASGKLTLYKSVIKSVTEASEINAGIIKTFNSSTRYFLEKEGNVLLVRLNKKGELVGLMSDKAKEIDDFIKKEKLNPRNEADAIQIIKYYNSLFS